RQPLLLSRFPNVCDGAPGGARPADRHPGGDGRLGRRATGRGGKDGCRGDGDRRGDTAEGRGVLGVRARAGDAGGGRGAAGAGGPVLHVGSDPGEDRRRERDAAGAGDGQPL
ncbi:MAG: hypothetical protein AVDCRST_MAG19-947, partial [uncultured Thermomicrobiales bacterium]